MGSSTSIQLRVGRNCEATSTSRGTSSVGRVQRKPPTAGGRERRVDIGRVGEWEVEEMCKRQGGSRREPVAERDAEQRERDAADEQRHAERREAPRRHGGGGAGEVGESNRGARH